MQPVNSSDNAKSDNRYTASSYVRHKKIPLSPVDFTTVLSYNSGIEK